MEKLNFKNYREVVITVRGEDAPIRMEPHKGLKLMDYLVSDNANAHVRLTDVDGNPIVVRTTDILKVTPIAQVDLEKYA